MYLYFYHFKNNSIVYIYRALVHLDRLKNMVNSKQSEGQGQTGSGRVTPLCAHMEDNM